MQGTGVAKVPSAVLFKNNLAILYLYVSVTLSNTKISFINIYIGRSYSTLVSRSQTAFSSTIIWTGRI